MVSKLHRLTIKLALLIISGVPWYACFCVYFVENCCNDTFLFHIWTNYKKAQITSKIFKQKLNFQHSLKMPFHFVKKQFFHL